MEKSPQHLPSDTEFLAKIPLFAELSPAELQILVRQSSFDTFAPGERIVTAGEPGHCMYVVLSGRAEVTTGKQVLATLTAGDFFGEVALVDDGPRSADVTASEACKLLCITSTTIGVLAGLEPGAAIHLLAAIGRCLVARLRACQQKYMDLVPLGGQSS